MSKITEILKLTEAMAQQATSPASNPRPTGWEVAAVDTPAPPTSPATPPRTPKAMLTAQANTLAALFDHLAAQASAAPNMQQTDGLLRLALKVQGQCVQTLRVLNEIDNPRQVAFVQQANIAHGPQQIINGSRSPVTAENEPQANKLLE